MVQHSELLMVILEVKLLKSFEYFFWDFISLRA